jgi:UDP:flavonoid glycosyltransferase YjiC (YdhE family)
LEALAQGVPLVAIPIGYDQPGIASRIAYHGVGEFVELDDLSKQQLLKLIAKVTSNPSYRDKARWFQNILREKRGLGVAADIIEQVFGITNEGRTPGSFRTVLTPRGSSKPEWLRVQR